MISYLGPRGLQRQGSQLQNIYIYRKDTNNNNTNRSPVPKERYTTPGIEALPGYLPVVIWLRSQELTVTRRSFPHSGALFRAFHVSIGPLGVLARRQHHATMIPV